jgi:excisionase family DNA binding protein
MELSLQQAAAILGKTRRQVLYMIDQGRLPGKKVGGRWVIDRVDLQVDEAMQQRTRQKQARFRAVVEDVLTPATERRYSLRDLKAVQLAEPIVTWLCVPGSSQYVAGSSPRWRLA